MNPLHLAIVGVFGLVIGAAAGGALGVFEGDTKTERVTQTTTVVTTTGKTRTKTVRARSGGSRAPRTVTVTRTVESYRAPGEPTGGGGRTVVNGTRTFTGKDTKSFGNLRVGQPSTLEWTNSGQVFSVISETQLHVSSTKKKGSTRLFEGTYRNFRVAAVGRWKVTIKPR